LNIPRGIKKDYYVEVNSSTDVESSQCRSETAIYAPNDGRSEAGFGGPETGSGGVRKR